VVEGVGLRPTGGLGESCRGIDIVIGAGGGGGGAEREAGMPDTIPIG